MFLLRTSKLMSHTPEMDGAATSKAETEAEATLMEGEVAEETTTRKTAATRNGAPPIAAAK